MELVKKNIHTERIKAKALLQIPLEEDINGCWQACIYQRKNQGR